MNTSLIFAISTMIAIPSILGAVLYARRQLMGWLIENRADLSLSSLIRRLSMAGLIIITSLMLFLGGNLATMPKDIIKFTTFWFVWMGLVGLIVILAIADGAEQRRNIMEKREQIITEFMVRDFQQTETGPNQNEHYRNI